MPTIRFLRAYTVKDAASAKYAPGDLLECSEATASHFLDRRAAERYEPPKPVAQVEPEASKVKVAKRGKQDEQDSVQQ